MSCRREKFTCKMFLISLKTVKAFLVVLAVLLYKTNNNFCCYVTSKMHNKTSTMINIYKWLVNFSTFCNISKIYDWQSTYLTWCLERLLLVSTTTHNLEVFWERPKWPHFRRTEIHQLLIRLICCRAIGWRIGLDWSVQTTEYKWLKSHHINLCAVARAF